MTGGECYGDSMVLARTAAIAIAISGCYGIKSPTSCTLTCDQARPCPDNMVCGADQLCRGPELGSCSGQPQDDAGPDMMRDGGLLDSCPSSYDVTLPSTTGTSKYRLVDTQNFFWTIEDQCRRDAPGLTHMVVTESIAELEEAFAQVGPIGGPRNLACWFGMVHDPAAAAAVGWIRLDGAADDGTQWLAGEPNTAGRDVAGIRCSSSVPRMIDALGQEDGISLCECDGKTVSATAIQFMAADPDRL